ncbi:MAG TPA: zinc-binding alcohol dehydrogenase family protein [Candidatus Eremiobacteraceae bacterium]|nr:zinc-binding alcohol dehydrogenase family protein [Candidatus Eremiobacteraceae bacterium]
MKALVLKHPGEVAVEEIAEPARGQDDLLLRVRRVGLCGSDLNSFRGTNPLVSYPRILGHEIAATIVTGNESHPGLSAGVNVAVSPYSNCGECAACRKQRPNACQFNQTMGVQRDGALTEFIVLPAGKLYASALGLKELCLVEPLTVGFHAVARGRVTKADTVAIMGCGGVGLGAISAAHFAGARTIGIDIEESKLELARKAGADQTIHARSERLHDRLLEITNGLGPDVFIEAIGSPETFRTAVEDVGFAGRVVYIGYAKAPVTYESRLFVQKELDILGSRNALPDDFRRVICMLEAGQFPASEAVTVVAPMKEAPKLLREWSQNPGQFAKIMVDLD